MGWKDKLLLGLMSNKLMIKAMSIPIFAKTITALMELPNTVQSLVGKIKPKI